MPSSPKARRLRNQFKRRSIDHLLLHRGQSLRHSGAIHLPPLASMTRIKDFRSRCYTLIIHPSLHLHLQFHTFLDIQPKIITLPNIVDRHTCPYHRITLTPPNFKIHHHKLLHFSQITLLRRSHSRSSLHFTPYTTRPFEVIAPRVPGEASQKNNNIPYMSHNFLETLTREPYPQKALIKKEKMILGTSSSDFKAQYQISISYSTNIKRRPIKQNFEKVKSARTKHTELHN